MHFRFAIALFSMKGFYFKPKGPFNAGRHIMLKRRDNVCRMPYVYNVVDIDTDN